MASDEYGEWASGWWMVDGECVYIVHTICTTTLWMKPPFQLLSCVVVRIGFAFAYQCS